MLSSVILSSRVNAGRSQGDLGVITRCSSHGSLLGALVFHSFGPRGGLRPSALKDSASCFHQLYSPTSASTVGSPECPGVSAHPRRLLPALCLRPVGTLWGRGAESNIHPAPCLCRHGLPGSTCTVPLPSPSNSQGRGCMAETLAQSPPAARRPRSQDLSSILPPTRSGSL